jgi:hypothetical protein
MSDQREAKAAYASIQAIREGAGLSNRSENEKLSGTVDGSNAVFTVRRRPIVDTNYDDTVGPEDVKAYVDGVSVEVTNVDAAAGTIELAVAPASGVVTADYRFSPISDEYVQTKQLEANSWVDLKIKGYIAVPLQDPIPGIITTAAEMYAAGLILTRDWGSRVDSELTSKDGFNKIKQARELINDYIQGLKDEREKKGSSNNNSVSAMSDGDVFSRTEIPELDAERGDPTDDNWFMRRD